MLMTKRKPATTGGRQAHSLSRLRRVSGHVSVAAYPMSNGRRFFLSDNNRAGGGPCAVDHKDENAEMHTDKVAVVLQELLDLGHHREKRLTLPSRVRTTRILPPQRRIADCVSSVSTSPATPELARTIPVEVSSRAPRIPSESIRATIVSAGRGTSLQWACRQTLAWADYVSSCAASAPWFDRIR